jgi:hypothetical protein
MNERRAARASRRPTYSELAEMGGQKERAAGDLMRCGPESSCYVNSGRRTRTVADGNTINGANSGENIAHVVVHSASPSFDVRSKLRHDSI